MLPVPLQDAIAQPRHLPLQHGAGRLARRPELNVKQTYTVTRVTRTAPRCSATTCRRPPRERRPAVDPDYDALAKAAVRHSAGGRKVFAGPARRSVLRRPRVDLRPRRPPAVQHRAHDPAAGRARQGRVRGYNVHTIAIQVPKTRPAPRRRRDGDDRRSTRSASRPKIRILRGDGTFDTNGPLVQVSRLGNPLVNEVLIPVGKKDLWNASDPRDDSQFADRYTTPELAGLENALYPVLDDTPTTGRGDLTAVLLTGVPTLNFTGSTKADLLRLNTSFTAPPVGTGNRLGLLGGDFFRVPERAAARGRRHRHRAAGDRLRVRAGSVPSSRASGSATGTRTGLRTTRSETGSTRTPTTRSCRRSRTSRRRTRATSTPATSRTDGVRPCDDERLSWRRARLRSRSPSAALLGGVLAEAPSAGSGPPSSRGRSRSGRSRRPAPASPARR